MIDPKDIEIPFQDGTSRTFVISKFPAVQGREIVTKYPLSNMPKLGDYAVSEETMLKLMAHVGIRNEETGAVLPLSTRALVDNHVKDWEALARLEWAMMEYNCSFFAKGLTSGFFESISQKAVLWLSQMLTDLSAASSKPAKPRSKN